MKTRRSSAAVHIPSGSLMKGPTPSKQQFHRISQNFRKWIFLIKPISSAARDPRLPCQLKRLPQVNRYRAGENRTWRLPATSRAAKGRRPAPPADAQGSSQGGPVSPGQRARPGPVPPISSLHGEALQAVWPRPATSRERSCGLTSNYLILSCFLPHPRLPWPVTTLCAPGYVNKSTSAFLRA